MYEAVLNLTLCYAVLQKGSSDNQVSLHNISGPDEKSI